MKIIDGLQNNQAVELDNGNYLVQLNSGTYKIDNEEHRVSQNQILVESINDIQLKIVTYSNEIKEYYSPKNNKTISLDEYNDLNVRLTELFTAKKHSTALTYSYYQLCDYMNNFKTVYDEPVISYKKVEIDVIGTLEDTGSDFIKTAFSLSKSNFYNGIYSIQESEIALDEYNKIRSVNKDLTAPQHNSIKFTKFKDKFLFANDDVKFVNDRHSTVTRTLDEAKQREAYIRKYINDKLYHYIHLVKIDVYVKDVINDLEHILNTFNKVESLKSTKFEHNYGIVELRKCIKKLQEIE